MMCFLHETFSPFVIPETLRKLVLLKVIRNPIWFSCLNKKKMGFRICAAQPLAAEQLVRNDKQLILFFVMRGCT